MPTTYIQETTIEVGHGQENRLHPSEVPLLSMVSKSVLHDVWSGSKLAAIKTGPPRTGSERSFLDVSDREANVLLFENTEDSLG